MTPEQASDSSLFVIGVPTKFESVKPVRIMELSNRIRPTSSKTFCLDNTESRMENIEAMYEMEQKTVMSLNHKILEVRELVKLILLSQ